MQIPRKIDYACVFLASLRPTYASGAYVTIAEIARSQNLPKPFLEKLASILRKKQIVAAKIGTNGGYRLMRDPASLALKEIIDIFEEPPLMRCLRSNHPEQHCPLAATCPTRNRWRAIEEALDKVFDSVTVASF